MVTDNDSTLATRIAAQKVAPNRVVAWWLGGSGFMLKTAAGATILLDPYLSNSVQAGHGMGRAVPIPLDPAILRPDVVISTHWHEDHLDPETIPVIARNSSETKFVMPPSAMGRAVGWGIARSRITAMSWGDRTSVVGVDIEAVPARHDLGVLGWETPDAMGVILHSDGVTIYNSGDTEHDARLRNLRGRRFDAAMVCINGVTGNMDAHEAALLVWQLGAHTVIPMHHVLWDRVPWPEETLAPNLFAQTYKNLGGKGRIVLPEVGEAIVIGG